MKKTSLFIIACVVVSLTFGVLTFLPGNAGATTRYVGGGGPGNYTTIQGAIDDANPGDSVFVYNGAYYENVVVYKPLSLIGESKDTTMIYNVGTGDVILVASGWVNVTGDCNLTVAGIVPAQTTIHLYEGWNLVSFPSFNASYSVSDLKAEVGATRVEGYDLAPPNFLRVLGDAEVLQAGYGYWVRVEADADWTVKAS